MTMSIEAGVQGRECDPLDYVAAAAELAQNDLAQLPNGDTIMRVDPWFVHDMAHASDQPVPADLNPAAEGCEAFAIVSEDTFHNPNAEPDEASVIIARAGKLVSRAARLGDVSPRTRNLGMVAAAYLNSALDFNKPVH